MKTGAVIAVVAGALILVFWATSRGLVNAGVAIGPGGRPSGIVAPQPSQNYSGWLAASTAGGVSNILNTALSGLNNVFGSWMQRSPQAPTVAQGANSGSPSLAAQPVGVTLAQIAALNQSVMAPGTVQVSTSDIGSTLVGPQVDPAMSYAATAGSAFDMGGLYADNAYDPSASLDVAFV
jgi:hypothetical protein